jgi:hypothetical protein
MIGVLYKSKPHKKLNGTLFYCYEYCQLLRQHSDVKLYLFDVTPVDFDWICSILEQKYTTSTECVVRVEKYTDVYSLGMDASLILDVVTLNTLKELVPGDILCYSNDSHNMWRSGRPGHTTTYFGYYDYQPRDVTTRLKLYFDIHRPCNSAPGVYVTALDMDYIAVNSSAWGERFQRPVITKKPNTGKGNMFDYVDWVHYVHTGHEKNNRIIPEAFWHGKQVTIDTPFNLPTDSAMLRYADITANGIQPYVLTVEDEMVQACLKYCD